jgi:hypothetical protein
MQNPVFDLAHEMQKPSAHFEANNQLANKILQQIKDLPPYHPQCDEYTHDDGLIELKCFYTFEKGVPEDAINPAEPDLVTLDYCYVGNVNIMAGLTLVQKMAIEAEIMGTLS